MRFKVTGGQDGTCGIDIGDKRFEPGDEIELTAKQSESLLEQGYVESLDVKKKSASVVEEATIESEVK